NEFGFADHRTGKPNNAWKTLSHLAASDGRLGSLPSAGTRRLDVDAASFRSAGEARGKAWSKVEKLVQQIRRTLRQHFDIEGDPLPFVKGTGCYIAVFRIKRGTSYKT